MTDNETVQGPDILATFSVATKDNGPLTKIMRVDPETGAVIKDASQCSMSKGYIQQKIIRSFQQLGDGIRRMGQDQAMVHGVPQHKKAAIVSVSQLPYVKTKPGALPVIARSKEYISYPDGPALMMFDHDKARPNSVAENDGALQSFSPVELIQLITRIMREMGNAGWVSTPSTSSCIFDQTGKELRGEGSGFHLYFVVEHGHDIPRFLKVLGKRLFLAGYGRVEISRSGALLFRTLIDLSVGSPERLDFAAGAVCEDGLVQKLPAPQVQEGTRLNTALLPDLTPAEEAEYEAIKARLTELAKPSQTVVKEKYLEQAAGELSTERGISLIEAREIVLSRQNHVLKDGDQLYFAHLKGKSVSGVLVAEVLDNPTVYHKKSLADPLEPEYGGGSMTKALFYWNDGHPIINSFAHGETKYTFERFKKAAPKKKKSPGSAKGSTVPPAENKASNNGLVLYYQDPLDAAKKFAGTGRIKRYWQRCLFEYNGSAYQEKTTDDLKADIYRYLEGAKVMNPDTEEIQPYLANRNRVGEILEALRATVNLPDTLKPPCFISGSGDHRECLAVKNGLLDISTRRLIEPTPDFFTLNSLPFAYDRDATDPIEWLKFLRSIWLDDQQAIDVLQEVFGYLLTADTSQQKIFGIIGPMRSGKGTIGRIMTAFLGPDNVCAPTLGSLAQQFGLAGLIGKKAAIISDARLSGKADQAAIAERLLSISGEDHQGVPRKFLSDYNGPLQVRFVIFSNEIPRLSDASSALPSRFILLTMKKSFLGQEDHGLTKRLMRELPGILNWSLDGLDRLNRRGFFIQPDNGKEAIQELADLASPISAFLREKCVQGPEHTVSAKLLYTTWCEWCEDQGRDYPGNLQSFGRDLRAAIPGLSLVQPRTFEGRQRMYQGVGLC